jgi:hypothetical protein
VCRLFGGGSHQFKQDVLRITGAGTGIMERKGVGATWQLLNGELITKVGTDTFRYRRLGDGALGEERWLMEELDAAGQSLSLSEIMAVRASVVTIDTVGLSKRWQTNLNTSVLGGLAFHTLKADGGWAITSKEPGQLETTATFNRYWRRLADGRLELVTGRPGNCNPLISISTCTLNTQRFWTLLGQQGKTLFVMEQGPGFPPAAIESWRFIALTEAAP